MSEAIQHRPHKLNSKVSSNDGYAKGKKSPHKKQIRLWHFFSHPKRHVKDLDSTNKNHLLDEQFAKITALSDYAKDNLSVALEDSTIQSVLEANDWNMRKARVELENYEEAALGLLRPLPDATQVFLGSVNDQNTSCYINSLLFAMYANLTTFDPLLTYDTTSEELEKQKLQIYLRLYVNTLRKGHLVKGDFIQSLRRILQECSWHGQNEAGVWTQEDASELFMFLTEIFELPYIPFQLRLFHGANQDSDDDRVMTDRALMISVPFEAHEARLEILLLNHFYSSMVTGVKRNIDYTAFAGAFGTDSAPEYTEESPPEKVHFTEKQEEVAVAAWQVLELLPFYSACNEQGTAIRTQAEHSFPDHTMMVPIVLKRYQYDLRGGCTKNKSRVTIPSSIPFNAFVNQNADTHVCPLCNKPIEFIMHLRSAVCHKGDSPSSGHYISYARMSLQEDSSWLKQDDMAIHQRIRVIPGHDAEEVFEELSRDAYILFYEFNKTCEHSQPAVAFKAQDEKRGYVYGENITLQNHYTFIPAKSKDNRTSACTTM
ncbi:hypothetical protein BDF14DRAFT_1878653 [Spinellus fusiger]|nr:hypothetical protein BDF14DRAFT_1878653 [Spinellus fusiger]